MRCPALNKIQPLAQYHAFIPSLGIHTTNSALCLTHTGVLILKERGGLVSGGDSFEIKDGDGRGVMMVKGRGLKGELKETKEIREMDDKLLFKLENKLFSTHKGFVGVDEEGREVLKVQQKFALGKTRLLATFKNGSDEKDVELELKGSLSGTHAEIHTVDGGRTVASIARQMVNIREVVLDQQTYFVTVAPGVDLSLVVAICIALDEVANEQPR